MEPLWLDRKTVDAIHFHQILAHGGAHGIRDDGLLESALARARNRWHYEKVDIVTLAAAYGFGLAKNHGYIDGNKRTAFLAMYTFLGLNGLELDAPEADAVVTMLAVAAGAAGEGELAEWLREWVRPWEDEADDPE